MMLCGRGGGGGRRLFTASQWQELEHQALIYKYMASGAPVPHDLVLPLRLATGVDTAPSLAFPPQPPSLGYWGCYSAGAQFGRKAEDQEPGRCRRTDGKKWRCSREAHGDSKYCEKHIHRGKNRSRKPVEVTSSASSPATVATAYRPSAFSISPPRAPTYEHHHQLHHGASSARTPAQTASPLQLHLDAGFHATSPPPPYHMYAHAYSTPPSSLFPDGFGYAPSQDREEAEMRRQHYLALGADLSLDKPPAAAGRDAAGTEKLLRRFFDEWPRESSDGRAALMGVEEATQLSISIPVASPSDLAAAASRYHNGQ
ncbi:growth-regulating factor 2-like isoform X2 [Phragmites australis]|uniref:growth-regulating factor 2-like isoform X2 n=1 Tax=Phragmites australis TaxID=29695 RepID=UPI002D76501A|nr:growth-regulating factor 2-like isoform X2 [Phragmites australis]